MTFSREKGVAQKKSEDSYLLYSTENDMNEVMKLKMLMYLKDQPE